MDENEITVSKENLFNPIIQEVRLYLEKELDIEINPTEWNFIKPTKHSESFVGRIHFGFICPKHFGIFKAIINSCELTTEVWIVNKDDIVFVPQFHYEHPGGGCNGCELNFRLRWNISRNILDRIGGY